MKKLKNRLLIPGFMLFLLFCSGPAKGDEVFRNFTEDRFDSSAKINFFKTEANFGKSGSQQNLPASSSFQLIDTFVQGRYVVAEDFGLYGGANMGSSESNDAIATRRNSTLNFVHIGADYLFYQSPLMSLYADASYHHALEKIARDTDSALNSDGASEFKAQVVSLFDLKLVQPYGALGVNYRLEGLSTLLTYSLGVQSSFGAFVLGVAMNGFVSVVDDSKTGTPLERDQIRIRVNGSSQKFYAINPNNLEGDLYVKYIWNEDFSIGANGGYTVMGSNAAVGYHIGASLNWGFGRDRLSRLQKAPVLAPRPVTAPVQRPAVPPQAQPQTRPVIKPVPAKPIAPIKKFQEDTNDGVDQNYFKPVTPSKENYIRPVEGKKPLSIQEEYNVKPKKAAPAEPLPNEYKIKLKKVKKKKN